MIALLWIPLTALALERPAPLPEPLPSTPWTLPQTDVRTLSNGLEVHVAINDEVPLWEVRLVLDVGEYLDPVGKEGLAEVTLDMMNEGAGDMSAGALSRKLRTLAGSIDTSARSDTAVVSASGIERNLEPVLDLWTTVLLEPTFPESDWDVLRKGRIQDLELGNKNPDEIARKAWGRIVWGDGFIGRNPSPESLAAITPADMRSFYETWIGPQNAVIVVGGAVDPDHIVELLEARIGDWAPEGIQETEPDPTQQPVEAETIYFIDNPGATQSTLQSGTELPPQTDPGFHALEVANQQFGRAFTARVNMNLREDKGYTYGARCYAVHWIGPGQYTCRTSVRADVTAESLGELRGEIAAALGDRPLSDDEIAIAKASMIQSYPSGYETTGPLLDEVVEIWQYGLPEDWITRYIDEIRKVDTAAANAAMRNAISPERTFWLVVGDKSQVFEGLQATGLPIVELDTDGRPLE